MAQIVFFDGVCNLCNQAVDFLMRYDRHGHLRFASLQGATARACLPAPLVDQLNSMVFSDNGRVFTNSAAVIRSLAALGGVYRCVRLALLIPAPWRDALYGWVASHRYAWFGQRQQCRLPTPAEQSRFLP